MSENKGVQSECKIFSRKFKRNGLFQRFVRSIEGCRFWSKGINFEDPRTHEGRKGDEAPIAETLVSTFPLHVFLSRVPTHATLDQNL